jgi:hypothetical protein
MIMEFGRCWGLEVSDRKKKNSEEFCGIVKEKFWIDK